MRKLTYQRAATCGENLNVQVTPEQSEKMQLAWFAAGKKWVDRTREIKHTEERRLFLHKDGDMTYWNNNKNVATEIESEVCHDYYYSSYPEIELIDDLPQHDFASQQEVWAWLSTSESNRVIAKNGRISHGFLNGVLMDFYKNQPAEKSLVVFIDEENWQKHTPPRLIRVNGVEVPAPLESLDGIDSYWTPAIHSVFGSEKATKIKKLSGWSDDDYEFLNNGLCYANKEDAIKRAEVMRIFEVVE